MVGERGGVHRQHPAQEQDAERLRLLLRPSPVSVRCRPQAPPAGETPPGAGWEPQETVPQRGQEAGEENARAAAMTAIPTAVVLAEGPVAVRAVVEEWLVEDEWWRTPLARRYLRLELVDGRLLTLFVDLVHGGWYRQPYHAPAPPPN